MTSSPAQDIAAPPPPALAPGWSGRAVALLQELAELSMAHARAVTLELADHAERVRIGDLTPMSRDMVMQSSAAFARAARCTRLTLAMIAEACDPNAKSGCSRTIIPAIIPAKAGTQAMAPQQPPAPTSPDSERDSLDRDTLDRDPRERDIEREYFPKTSDFPAYVRAELAAVRKGDYHRHFPNGRGMPFRENAPSSEIYSPSGHTRAELSNLSAKSIPPKAKHARKKPKRLRSRVSRYPPGMGQGP